MSAEPTLAEVLAEVVALRAEVLELRKGIPPCPGAGYMLFTPLDGSPPAWKWFRSSGPDAQ